MGENNQLTLFGSAIQPIGYHSEIDDRYDDLILCGCPRGILQLIVPEREDQNVAAQYDAVKELLDLGFTFQEIKTLARKKKVGIDHILAFGKLPKALADGVRESKIATGMARQLLKMAAHELTQLKKLYLKNGKLSPEDLQTVRQVSNLMAAKQLPDSLFTPAPDPKSELERIVRELVATQTPEQVRAEFDQTLARVLEFSLA